MLLYLEYQIMRILLNCMYPVCYYSKKLLCYQISYSTIEKEAIRVEPYLKAEVTSKSGSGREISFESLGLSSTRFGPRGQDITYVSGVT